MTDEKRPLSCPYCEQGVPFCDPPYDKWHQLSKTAIATCFARATVVPFEWVPTQKESP